jgi:Fe2+ transport system protein FeoA
MIAFRLIALGELAVGERGVIRQFHGGRMFTSRLTALGFTIGARVRVIQNYGRGPVIVEVCDTHVALGRFEARRILVEVMPVP